MYIHARMRSYTHRHVQCTHPCTHNNYNIDLREAKPLKNAPVVCVSSAGMASPSFFHPCVPSRQWKGLGQRESMAQKTPRVSASQWQITVPSSKQRCLKEENHSVFSLLWKRTEKGCSGEWEADVGFSRLLSSCNALTPVKHCIVRNGWYAHQWQFTGGTELHRHTQHTHIHTLDTAVPCTNILTKRNHKWLNSILQRSLAMLVLNTWDWKKKVNRGHSISFCMHHWSIVVACLLKPWSKHGECSAISLRWMQGRWMDTVKKTHTPFLLLCLPNTPTQFPPAAVMVSLDTISPLHLHTLLPQSPHIHVRLMPT